jgi:hypothetical protein
METAASTSNDPGTSRRRRENVVAEELCMTLEVRESAS